MKKSLIVLSLACLLANAPSAFSESPSFSYVEAGYRDLNNFTGLTVRASVELSDYVYINGQYNDLTDENEFGGRDFDVELYDIGLGVKFDVSSNTALYLEADYVNSEDDFDDENGYRASIGARTMLNNNIQFYADLAHLDLHRGFTEATAGFKFYVNGTFGFFVEGFRNDFEADGYSAGLSVRF